MRQVNVLHTYSKAFRAGGHIGICMLCDWSFDVPNSKCLGDVVPLSDGLEGERNAVSVNIDSVGRRKLSQISHFALTLQNDAWDFHTHGVSLRLPTPKSAALLAESTGVV